MNREITYIMVVACGLMLTAINSLHAQSNAYLPVKVNGVDTPPLDRDYYRHGYNQFHLTAPFVGESIDSVTVSSLIKYFVAPDSILNPNWYDANGIKDIHDVSNLNTTFSWTVINGGTGGTGVNATVPDPGTNLLTPFIQVGWNRLSSNNAANRPDTLVVIGTPAINGTKSTRMPVRVINKPTVSFSQQDHSIMQCAQPNDLKASILLNVPFDVTSDVNEPKEVMVSYKVESYDPNGTPVTADNHTTNVQTGAEYINIQCADYGRYVVTLTGVSDRISRKCLVNGDLPVSAGLTFTITVMPPPKTITTYKIPNK